MDSKKEELKEFFKGRMGRPDAEALTEAIISTVKHIKGKELYRQTDADHIEGALKKINLALGELDKTTGPEGRHLKKELQKVKDQAATPTQKRKTERAYFSFRTIHDKPEIHSVETERKKRTGDQAEFLYRIWAFWVNEFDEKPSKYRDHPFFELAGILLGIDAGSVHRQWLRNTREVTK